MKVLLALATSLALAALTPTRDVAAQSAHRSQVDTGPRVRITQTSGVRRAGLLLVLATDSVVAEWPSGAAEAIPRSAITKLELSSGRRHFPWRGAAAGVMIGAGMGKLLSSSLDRSLEERARQGDAETCGPSPAAGCGLSDIVRSRRSNGWMIPLAIVSGAAGGAMLGHVGIERWRTVADGASARRVGMLVDLSHDRAAIGLSLPR